MQSFPHLPETESYAFKPLTPAHGFFDETSFRSVGRVGFDTITLFGLIKRKDPFPDPVEDFLDEAVRGTAVKNGKYKVTLAGDRYEFSFGNKNQRPFSKIKLHASKEGEQNLWNLSVIDVWNLLDAAIADINRRFLLNISYKREDIRIYDAEINITFPIQNPFFTYRRILDLMIAASKDKIKYGKISNDENKIETVYIARSRTKKVKIYDKTKELIENRDIDCGCHLMRYEIYGLEPYLSGISNNDDEDHVQGQYQLHLKNINDESLQEFFYDEVKELLDRMENFLQENTNFQTEFSRNLGIIFSIAIQKMLRTDPADYIEKILQQYVYYEHQEYAPVILDIQDLISALEDAPLDKICREQFVNTLTDMQNRPGSYNEICSMFIGQRLLYDELKEKLTNKALYPISILENGINNRPFVVWWSDFSYQYYWLDSVYDMRILVDPVFKKYDVNDLIVRVNTTPPITYMLHTDPLDDKLPDFTDLSKAEYIDNNLWTMLSEEVKENNEFTKTREEVIQQLMAEDDGE